MRRKKLAKLLFWLKVLAICGAAVFMIKGVGKFYADAGNDASKEEETGEVQVTEESATTEPETVVMLEIEENAIAERQSVEEVIEYQSDIPSMDWDAEESYLLAKIAMAEAEGEDIEGKALVMLVVLNRVFDDEFPDAIEEVIYQPGQFSPVSNGRFDKVEPDTDCWAALDLIMLDKWDESCGAIYFESKSESTWHSENLIFLYRHGKHYFYTDREEDGD